MRKTVLITGASRGIGKAAAEHLLRRGHRPILAMRNLSDRASQFDDADCIEMDVTSAVSVHSAMKRLSERGQTLDGVINNAAVFHGHDPLGFPQQQATEMFQSNFLGAWRVISACLPFFQGSQKASIVNVSSMTASLGLTAREGDIPGNAETRIAYCCLKAALNMLTLQLSEAFARAPEFRHVELYALSPGYTATRMNGFTGTLSPEAAGAFISAPFIEPSFDRSHLFQGPDGPLEW